MNHSRNPTMEAETGLTSTTAPGKVFQTRGELAEHYKSDWHKYNLKRREAGLPLLREKDFTARWEAALAMKKEKEAKAGTSHLKKTSKKAKNRKNSEDSTNDEDLDSTDDVPKKSQKEILMEQQENPEIDPKQCLFDPVKHASCKANIDYMQKKYGFFIPDKEYLIDLEGLLGYLQEKVKLGHFCLYCEKVFPTWQGCQKHMISKSHAKLKYEKDHWDELDLFYDFSKDDDEFMKGTEMPKESVSAEEPAIANMETDDSDEDGWEDMSEDGEDDGDEEIYRGYEQEIARFGLDVTPLGEIVMPDGRIIGHRALNRYYKQRVRPVQNSTAIVAARHAAGDQLYNGQVVNIGPSVEQLRGDGKGILVANKGGVEGFSALSLYRYRAAVRKQRRDDDKGRRLQYKTTQNINKMDKKHNRLMNGVSVAHAAR